MTETININWQNCNDVINSKIISPLKSVKFDGNYFVLNYDPAQIWPINSTDKECYACYIIKRNDQWVGNIFSKIEVHPTLVDAHSLIYMSKDVNRPIRGETIGFCLLSLDHSIRTNHFFNPWI